MSAKKKVCSSNFSYSTFPNKKGKGKANGEGLPSQKPPPRSMFLVISRYSSGPDRTCSPKGIRISMSPISVTRIARRGCWEVFVQMHYLNTQDNSKNNNDDANEVAGKPHILDTPPRQLPGTCFHSLTSIDGRAHGDHPLIC